MRSCAARSLAACAQARCARRFARTPSISSSPCEVTRFGCAETARSGNVSKVSSVSLTNARLTSSPFAPFGSIAHSARLFSACGPSRQHARSWNCCPPVIRPLRSRRDHERDTADLGPQHCGEQAGHHASDRKAHDEITHDPTIIPRPAVQMVNASNATLQIPIIKTASDPVSQSNQLRVCMTPSPHFLRISQGWQASGSTGRRWMPRLCSF